MMGISRRVRLVTTTCWPAHLFDHLARFLIENFEVGIAIEGPVLIRAAAEIGVPRTGIDTGVADGSGAL